jgi:hypothetical protein
MTVWLTPDRKPFYAGTYFPPRDGERGSRVGFLTLLKKTSAAYGAHPAEVEESSSALAERIRQDLAPEVATSEAAPDARVLRAAARYYETRFDAEHGGTRGRPKFPSNLPSRFLLRYHRRTGEQRALDMAVRTLERMAAGGVYDHVGGGFHRYSTDERWLVPHFEKMLYDNALLTVAYLEAHQATGRDDFARVAREILGYVARDMTSPEGAFFSATDADSPAPSGKREEGSFFTWTPAEIDAALDPAAARAVRAWYAVTERGNFAGRSILYTPRPLERVSTELGLEPVEMRALLERARGRLHAARTRRPAPLRDEKILAAWNGLMISAYARAALVLGEARYAGAASRAAEFVLDRMRENGRLRRSYKDGAARHDAYLDDYAFLIAALLDLYEATGDPRWLGEAIALDGVLERHYEDRAAGGFFMTSDDHERLLAREKPAYDGAEPSGNSVQVLNLLRLHALTTRDSYRERAERTLRAVAGVLERAPGALSEMLLALDFRTDVPKEIVIVARASASDAKPFLERLGATFLPNRTLSVVTEGEALERQRRLVPLVQGKVARGGRTTAYVCEQRVCDLPTSDPVVFGKQIAVVKPLPADSAGSRSP